MRHVLLSLVIFLSLFHLKIAGEAMADPAQVKFPQISKEVRISLITISPGNQLYTRFGHSAIRINDPQQELDIVYNYGTFDFDTPGFYTKFLRGKLLYFLSVYSFDRMVRTYEYFNQSVYEQELNLTFDQKMAVYNFLNWNYLPDNRYYLYDFFYDNCSSRIRDVFQDIVKENLDFHELNNEENKSFRQLLDEYLYVAPWEDFGIDIVLGLPADKKATKDQYMYLPEKMFDAFGRATISGTEGIQPFVSSTSTVFQASIADKQSELFSPNMVFWFLFFIGLIISVWQIRIRKKFTGIDITWFSIMGLAGWLVALLWFATDHIATKDNFNIIWLFPGHIFVSLILLKSHFKKIRRYYFSVVLISLIGVLAFWNIIPQQFHSAFIPVILIAITRSCILLIQNSDNYVARDKQ